MRCYRAMQSFNIHNDSTFCLGRCVGNASAVQIHKKNAATEMLVNAVEVITSNDHVLSLDATVAAMHAWLPTVAVFSCMERFLANQLLRNLRALMRSIVWLIPGTLRQLDSCRTSCQAS